MEAIRLDEYTHRRFVFFSDPDGLPLERYEAQAHSNTLQKMRPFRWLTESVRSGTIASLVMMPLGFLFKLLDLRVGYYGPKLAAVLFGEPTRFVLFAQHLVLGWMSALPLLLILVYRSSASAPTAVGAVYGVGYYAVVNSLLLPLLFGDPTPWQLGLSFVYPSLLVHAVFGASIGFTCRRFVAHARQP